MRESADALLARARSADEVQEFIEWVEGQWARGSG
jgi:hypothetical protein